MGKKPEISTSNFKSDLFDNFTDIILFIDLKGRVLYANKAVNKYGFKESDLIGESTYKLVVKKHVLQLTKEMLDLAKGKPTHGSVEIITPKGNFFMEYKSRPIKKNGKVIALQTILRDVTEQKKAEEQLMEAQVVANIGSWSYDVKTAQPTWSEQLFKIFGIDPKKGEPNYKEHKKYIHPDDWKLFDDSVMNTIKTGIGYDIEIRLVQPSGKIVWVNARCKTKKEKGIVVKLIGTTQDITEKKLAEEQLKESETRLKQISNNIQEWIWEIDEKGLYTYSNQTVKNILGYQVDELIGKKHFYDFFHPNDKEELKKGAFKAFARKKPFKDFVNRNVCKNGTIVYLSTSGVPIINSSGKLTGYIGADINITEQRNAEEALKESEEKFKTLVNKVSDIIYSYDIDGNIIFVSDNIDKYGYKVKEVIGKPLFNFIHPDDLKSVMKDFEITWKTGKSIMTEFRLKLKNGKYIFAEESGQLIYENNRPIKTIGVIRDVTERKQAEEKLIASEEQKRTIFEQNKDAIFIADVKSGLIIDCNDAATKLIERPKKELIGLHQTKLHPQEKLKLYADIFRYAVKSKGEVDTPVEVVTKSGNIKHVLITASIIKLKDKIINQGIFRDVTAQKKAEEKLKESEEQFRNMIDTVPGVVYKCDMNWTFSFASFAFKEVTGFPVSDVINNKVRSYVSLMFEDDVTRITPVLNKALKKKDKYFFSEYKLKTKTGDIKWVRDSVRIVYNKNGVAKGYEGVLSDITNIKTAEGELRKEKEFSENILKALPEGMDIVDEK